MLKVAVTGGIGAGKSTVSRVLADLGAIVIDSDQLARDVVDRGTAGLQEVVDAFGVRVLGDDGTLDRAELAGQVFADEGARSRLEGIIHPRVRQAWDAACRAAPPGAIVVNDIPLLRSMADAARYHLVLAIAADEQTRVDRLVRRGLNVDDARARIRAQIADAERRKLADMWLVNDHEHRSVVEAVNGIWRSRLVPMNELMIAGRPAPRPGPDLRPADPTWADVAAVLSARVSEATGGLRCDHIGSTAIPGLPAKDVIDLQLAVPDLATADAVADRLAGAGFPLAAGFTQDHPHPSGDDPRGWIKRLHQNADPGRAVNLHVRVDGAPNWRWALQFRDWLRANPEEQADYLIVKRQAARENQRIEGYADAKEAWLASAHTRMARWAAATEWSPASR